jgi:serine/threonine protein phosphatase PrpC
LKEKLDAEGCPADDAAAKKMVLAVDQEFLDTQQGSGSTAAMCIVRAPAQAGGKWKLHVINAGDSRVLLSRADGKIIDGGGTDSGLTTDHKPDHPSEKERIYRCGGTVEETAGGCARVNGDLAVSRGFGDADYKRTGGPGQEDHPVLSLCAPPPVHALGRTLLNPVPKPYTGPLPAQMHLLAPACPST